MDGSTGFEVPSDIIERFFAKVWRPNLEDCWVWMGAQNPKGYGTFRYGAKFYNAHRLVMMMALGKELDREDQIDHLCRVKLCVSPLHLEVVSGSENTRRAHAADPGITW